MRQFSLMIRIIGLAALATLLTALLSGCSMVRLAYNQAPEALYWWLDGYFDFDDGQSLRVKADLAEFQAWHRRHELPGYAELLRRARELAPAPLTPAQACGLFDQARAYALKAAERLEPTVVAIAPTLSLAQIAHLEHQLDKRNRKWRDEWLDDPHPKRQAKRVKDAVSRAESFYGRLDARQLDIVRAAIARSVYDPALTYRETVRRQQDALAVLRRLSGLSPADPRVRADMRALFDRSLESPDATYRTYLAALTRDGCAAVAELHNHTSAAQRAKAVHALKGYEDDFRALAAK